MSVPYHLLPAWRSPRSFLYVLIVAVSHSINKDSARVDMATGAEELKRRLEVLLGRPEDAPLDISVLERQKEQAEKIVRRERVAAAAGDLFASAFNLLGEIMPHQADDEMFKQKKEAVSTRLRDCLKIDDRGQLELKLKLPDQAALDNIAAALAKLVK